MGEQEVGRKKVQGEKLSPRPVQEDPSRDDLRDDLSGAPDAPASPEVPGTFPKTASEGGQLSHLDEKGRAKMVDVGAKEVVRRSAVAEGRILLQPGTVRLVRENLIKKGDVLTIAEVAGIQGAKQTHLLIPLCHPLQITSVRVKAALEEWGVHVRGEAGCTGRTGIEMEALMAVQVALLTVYDMCKAVDQTMRIEGIHLVEKKKEALC